MDHVLVPFILTNSSSNNFKLNRKKIHENETKQMIMLECWFIDNLVQTRCTCVLDPKNILLMKIKILPHGINKRDSNLLTNSFNLRL